MRTTTRKGGSAGLRWSDLYHYRITYDDCGEAVTFPVQSDDKLEAGSVVEYRGQLIEIKAGGPIPHRGVLTPLVGELI
ncbi:MAG TPA: hypothetical protein VMB53_03835 [Gaiellaceae bacterium]|nr:hypothetical protein [Gaiellaceae bacterium]